MENLSKVTTKEYFACQKCEKKLEGIEVGGGGSSFLDFSTKRTIMYCDNKECSKFGDLTIVGIKKTE